MPGDHENFGGLENLSGLSFLDVTDHFDAYYVPLEVDC